MGIFVSLDDGNTFASVTSEGLANTPVLKFAYQVSSDRLFAFTHGRGAYVAYLGSSATTGSNTGQSNNKLSVSQIIGIVIGSIFGFLIVIALVLFIVKSRQEKTERQRLLP